MPSKELILTEKMQTALIGGFKRRFGDDLSLEEIVSMLINGDIFIFDAKGLVNFYLEAELDPIICAKKDIESSAIIAADNMYFLIE
tara:strand:+ start:601 stop:858 length:258 start_codon:yes stop_codon:yes gene_type:complete